MNATKMKLALATMYGSLGTRERKGAEKEKDALPKRGRPGRHDHLQLFTNTFFSLSLDAPSRLLLLVSKSMQVGLKLSPLISGIFWH
jgi:hypothetical protein